MDIAQEDGNLGGQNTHAYTTDNDQQTMASEKIQSKYLVLTHNAQESTGTLASTFASNTHGRNKNKSNMI